MITLTRSVPPANTFEFWEHGQSGEVFAVRLDRGGAVTGLHGPLVSDQIHTAELPSYPYDAGTDDLQWVEAHRENWAPFEF